jgi:hypothetical protein
MKAEKPIESETSASWAPLSPAPCLRSKLGTHDDGRFRDLNWFGSKRQTWFQGCGSKEPHIEPCRNKKGTGPPISVFQPRRSTSHTTAAAVWQSSTVALIPPLRNPNALSCSAKGVNVATVTSPSL